MAEDTNTNPTAPATPKEWDNLIAFTDKKVESPSYIAERVFKKIKLDNPNMTNYELLCFSILVIPSLMAEALPYLDLFRKSCARLAYTLQIMHYVNKDYENGLSRKTDGDHKSKG